MFIAFQQFSLLSFTVKFGDWNHSSVFYLLLLGISSSGMKASSQVTLSLEMHDQKMDVCQLPNTTYLTTSRTGVYLD